MFFKSPPTLLSQAGLVIGLITLLAVLGIGSSFFITRTIQGAGATINDSGTLRMLSHKISTQMVHDQQQPPPDSRQIEQLINLFDSRLKQLSLPVSAAHHRLLTSDQNSKREIEALYHTIQLQWSHEIKPILLDYTTSLNQPDPNQQRDKNTTSYPALFQQRYLERIDQFVYVIDRLVKQIELQTESQIQLLYEIEYAALILLLLTIIAAPLLFKQKILLPLQDLLAIARQVRRRDFSSQAQYHRPDELGQLAEAFNLMISDLSATYTELEQRITDKTDSLIKESNRITLMEERNAIAQALHDSLAQSIFYLNIQITRLNTLIQQGAPPDQLGTVVDELKSSNREADHQLRELISTFRIRANPEGISAAVEEVIKKSRGRYPVDIDFDNQIPNFSFSHNEEVHLILIIQEAVSNIIKHARASHAEIRLNCRHRDNRIILTISDNGIGIPQNPERPNHFGLTTMHERAHSLGGSLQLSPGEEGGTQLTLIFTPSLQQEAPL